MPCGDTHLYVYENMAHCRSDLRHQLGNQPATSDVEIETLKHYAAF